MKNTTENVKKVPKFGVLDIVIILLVIISVLGIYFRYNIIDVINNARDIKEYNVSYTIDNVRYTTPNFINVGDKVYFSDDGEKFGTLTTAENMMSALAIELPFEYFTTTQGEIVKGYYPDTDYRVMAKGRLSCNGRYSDDGSFLVNGTTHIAMGQYIDVKTEYVTVTIRVDKIALVSE